MFGTLGVQEMIIIFLVALVLFGPRKLPELGRTIGKALTEFRRASNDLKATFEREMHTLERENESLKQIAQSTATDIYDGALQGQANFGQPAESTWNTLDNEISTALSAATQPATVGASEVTGAESNGTAQAAEATTPEPVPAIEGTAPRIEAPQHS